MNNAETFTLEEVDAEALGLGLIDLEVTVDYDFSPAEKPDFREIGYSRGYPGCPASIAINGVHVNSLEDENCVEYTREDDEKNEERKFDWAALDTLATEHIENDIEGYEEDLLANHGD